MFSYDVFETLCKEQGKTAYQVSRETGIATSTLSNWKLGHYTPKVDKISTLAAYFKVPVERFLK